LHWTQPLPSLLHTGVPPPQVTHEAPQCWFVLHAVQVPPAQKKPEPHGAEPPHWHPPAPHRFALSGLQTLPQLVQLLTSFARFLHAICVEQQLGFAVPGHSSLPSTVLGAQLGSHASLMLLQYSLAPGYVSARVSSQSPQPSSPGASAFGLQPVQAMYLSPS
jgi:hypothetical protein